MAVTRPRRCAGSTDAPSADTVCAADRWQCIPELPPPPQRFGVEAVLWCRHPIVRTAVEEQGWRVVEEASGDAATCLHWYDTTVSTERLRRLCARGGVVRVNHFPSIDLIARKVPLAISFNRMARLMPGDFDFLPRTFVDLSDFAKHRRLAVTERRDRKPFYIVKPSSGCMGKGITVTGNPPFSVFPSCVVQEYIDNPLLIDGKKCDLRCYVLVTSVHPIPRVYVYNEGLLRICAEDYSPPTDENCDSQFVHLTNFSVNKKHSDFSVGDGHTGGKRSFDFFNQWLRSEGHDADAFWDSVHAAVVKLILAVTPSISQAYCASCGGDGDDGFRCFELLGCDILVDADLQPWIVECNHSPSLVTDTCFDERIKKRMLGDMFRVLHLSPTASPPNPAPPTFSTAQAKDVQRRALMRRHRRRQAFERKPGVLGGWKSVYPADRPDRQELYDRILKRAAEATEKERLCPSRAPPPAPAARPRSNTAPTGRESAGGAAGGREPCRADVSPTQAPAESGTDSADASPTTLPDPDMDAADATAALPPAAAAVRATDSACRPSLPAPLRQPSRPRSCSNAPQHLREPEGCRAATCGDGPHEPPAHCSVPVKPLPPLVRQRSREALQRHSVATAATPDQGCIPGSGPARAARSRELQVQAVLRRAKLAASCASLSKAARVYGVLPRLPQQRAAAAPPTWA